jgi:SAM-dependent methyltransferase
MLSVSSHETWLKAGNPMIDDKLLQFVIGGESAPLQQIIRQCLRENISPAIAVMQLLIAMEDVESVENLLNFVMSRVSSCPSAIEERQRMAELQRLFRENREGCTRIARMLRDGVNASAVASSPEERLVWLAELFNWAVHQSEEASVALYSLGSPQLLQTATVEVIALLDSWKVLGRERIILQVGCGIGRFEAALASRVREAHGIDIAPGMVDAARRRCAGLENVFIQVGSGHDLGRFVTGMLDLVYAVDTCPYVHQAGPALLEQHFAEVARVLKPGGDFVILNFTYRGDPEADIKDVQTLARKHRFEILVNGACPLKLWDGRAWWLRHPELG